MTEPLRLCPSGHPADIPHLNDDDDSWVCCCDDPQCCWRYDGNNLSREEAVSGWNRRAPGPATKAMLDTWGAKRIEHKRVGLPDEIIRVTPEVFEAVLAEWAEFATPLAPASSWLCAICGKPVRIGDDLQPHHISYVGYAHAAELSDADRKTLSHDLRLTD